MAGRLSGKVAFITGAAMGQGRSHAVRLAEEGADIVATDRATPYEAEAHPQYRSGTSDDLEETRELVEKIGRRCVTAVADVRDRTAVQTAVDLGVAELGGIDIVCANAGVITFHERSWEIPDETYDLVVETNQRGVWHTIVCTVPSMIAANKGGSIIVTSSAAGIRGQFPYAHYTASKHAVVGMMKAFANELAPYRIRVNSVHPTGVDSPGMGREGAEVAMPIFMNNQMAMSGAINMLPDLDSPPTDPWEPVRSLPEREISQAVLWLASDESRYVTGVQLPVDAGNTNKA
jgi:SDR family mycofactocin-dependent oxidoreductase